MAHNNDLKLMRNVNSDDNAPMVSGDGHKNQQNVGEVCTYFVCDIRLHIKTKTKFEPRHLISNKVAF